MSADNISEEDLNQEINDKLNDLWSGMKNKRRQLMKNITPSYSRRTDQSQLNSTSNFNSFQSQHNILKLRQKLLQQVAQSKKKDIEIDMLKKTIAQLTNDKKMLLMELKENQKNSENQLLNESSIHNNQNRNLDGQTANFSTYKKFKDKEKQFPTIHEEPQSDVYVSEHQKLEKLSKRRLIQLLRSTSEYRQFVFYYDSHELSYLRRLQEQHRKNCEHTLSDKEKQFWAPTEIFVQLKKINKEEDWRLTEDQIEHLMTRFKYYYERNYDQKMTKLKKTVQRQIKRVQRENKNAIPYDLVQVCKAKERELFKVQSRTRTKSNIGR